MEKRTPGAAQASADLLERNSELEAVSEALATAAGGAGGLVVVQGAPGLGKTALIGAAMAAAREREMAVFSAAGSELEQEFAFGVAIHLFGRALAELSPDRREEVTSGAAQLAVPVLEGSDGDRDIQSLLHGFHWLTANLASEAPIALFVDDAQWADALSLRFLTYLLHRLEDLPAALFVAVRPSEGAARSESMALLRLHQATTVLDLKPLSSTGVGRLLRSELGEQMGDELCAACASASGGNPFLARELIEELDREMRAGILPVPDHVGAMAPDAVLWAVLARLGSLPNEATKLVRALAILGDGTPLRRAAQLAEIDPGVAASFVDALADVDVLLPSEPLSFSHALIQSAVAKDISPLDRAQVHLKAAAILHREGASPAHVAAQLLRSPPGSEDWVGQTLCAAARQAADRGDPEAARHYLVRALDEALDRQTRRVVLVDLAELEAALGTAAAVDRLEQALELASDPPTRARILSILGRVLFTAGRYEEAGDAFSRGLEEVGRSSDGELEQLLRAGHLAVAALIGPATADLADAADSLRWEERPALPEERALMAHLALKLALRCEPAAQVRDLALRALADGALLKHETSDSLTLNVVIGALFIIDATDISAQVLETAIEDARRRGSATAFATCSYSRGWVHYYAGRLREAAADLEFAIEARRYGWARFLGIAAQRLAHVRMELGDLAGAEAALEIPDRAVWETAQGPQLLEARGRLRLLQGDPTAAFEDLTAAGRAMAEMEMNSPGLSSWRSNAALAAARLEDASGAERLVAEEMQLARRAAAPRALGVALRTAGLLDRDGIAPLEESAALLEQSPSRLEHARTLVELGAALRRAGRREAAREPLRRALDMAEGFAAAPLAARAREELAATGARQPRRPLSGVESLTASELRAAKMAASGKTNREIAQELFVTRKAIEFHLGNVYRKLEIASRRELPGALESQEPASARSTSA